MLIIKIIIMLANTLTVYGRYGRCILKEYFSKSKHSYLIDPDVHQKDIKKELENIHLPRELCDYTHFVKKIINPYKQITHQLPPVVTAADDTKSVCLQCAACLVIAQQIDEAINKITLGASDPETEISQIRCSLKNTCDFDFAKYDLQNKDGYSIVTTNKNKYSVDNNSRNNGGKWSGRLKEFCTNYVSHINVFIFYSSLLKDKPEISNFLCRGDGVFRDCTNVNYKTIPITETFTNKQIILKIECT